jgi:hypothetical protein
MKESAVFLDHRLDKHQAKTKAVACAKVVCIFWDDFAHNVAD